MVNTKEFKYFNEMLIFQNKLIFETDIKTYWVGRNNNLYVLQWV